MDQATYMDLHTGTPFPLALDLTLSYARSFMESSVHAQFVKNEEARQKNDAATIGRLDVLIKAFGVLAKVINGAMSRR